jgi:hypothetical protein
VESFSQADSSPTHTRAANAKKVLKILIVTNIKFISLQKYNKINKNENIFIYFFSHNYDFLLSFTFGIVVISTLWPALSLSKSVKTK